MIRDTFAGVGGEREPKGEQHLNISAFAEPALK